MKETVTVDFNVTKKIGTATFEVPTDICNFLELIDEVKFQNLNMKWEVKGDEIRFYANDEQIGMITFWGPEEKND